MSALAFSARQVRPSVGVIFGAHEPLDFTHVAIADRHEQACGGGEMSLIHGPILGTCRRRSCVNEHSDVVRQLSEIHHFVAAFHFFVRADHDEKPYAVRRNEGLGFMAFVTGPPLFDVASTTDVSQRLA